MQGQIEDGTYKVMWRGASDDDPEVIITREISVRQVVVTSRYWKGNKPGTRLVLKESEEKLVVDSGKGTYLALKHRSE